MNDNRLSRILANRASSIKGCSVRERLFRNDGVGFRVESETGAIFDVVVTVYKDAIQ